MSGRRLAVLNGAVLLAALAAAGTLGPAPATSSTAAPAVAATPTPAAVATPTPTAGPTATPAPPPPADPAPRTVQATGWQPYAAAGPVLLHAPVDTVELVGFHQSGHDGAQQQTAAPGLRAVLLESRSRDTGPAGAADLVVPPGAPVRAPVTGTVLRAGTYALYCDHVDQFLVVEPDARPGWEVKLLHFEGLAVARGDRVEGGVTVVGTSARLLPFASQVDELTAEPSWPHLHLEVVDPSVPDRPSGRGCD